VNIEIRDLDPEDRGYALASWRESHKASPGCDRVPWAYYKHEFGTIFAKLINDDATLRLGAYVNDVLHGYLIATLGKRVDTLHWVQVKHEIDGKHVRRKGIASKLLEAADLSNPFIYTLRARRDRRVLLDGTMTKSLDESLVVALRAKGVTATFVPMKEFLK
jgi:hypothetical protein